MKRDGSDVFHKLKQYSLFASPLLALASSGHAQVTYVDINPDIDLKTQGGQFDQVNLDLNNDGITDFTFVVYSKYQSDSEGNKFNKVGVTPVQDNGNGILGFVVDAPPNKFYYPSALSANAVIGSSKNFWDYPDNVGTFIYYFPSHTFGPWNDLGDRYMGFRFKDNGGGTHYGWIRLDVHKADAEAVIKDYAYVDATDQAIIAGTELVGIEEVNADKHVSIFAHDATISIHSSLPSSGPLKIDVMDVSGRILLHRETADRDVQLAMNDAAVGIYLVKVTQDDLQVTRKVMIQ